MGYQSHLLRGINMNSVAALFFFTSAAYAAPQFFQPSFGNFGFKNVGFQSQPAFGNFVFKNAPKATVYLANSNSPATVQTQFGTFPAQGIIPEQRATYLPVMKALLKVMQTSQPSTQDLNTLMILTRELNKKVPKGETNLLGNLGNLLGNFGFGDLESMGLPESGDIVMDIDGIAHVRTSFGVFPFPERNLMTAQDKSKFLPIIKNFADVLEENGANKGKTNLLLQQSKKLAKLIPENLRNSIPGI